MYNCFTCPFHSCQFQPQLVCQVVTKGSVSECLVRLKLHVGFFFIFHSSFFAVVVVGGGAAAFLPSGMTWNRLTTAAAFFLLVLCGNGYDKMLL